jgi:hypothetical protein
LLELADLFYWQRWNLSELEASGRVSTQIRSPEFLGSDQVPLPAALAMKLATDITEESSSDTTVAATLAPEDVACGDFVAVLNMTFELPTYMWDAAQAMLPVDELIRLQLIPSDSGVPLKVFGVCLPFVYVKSTAGDVLTLDTRRHRSKGHRSPPEASGPMARSSNVASGTPPPSSQTSATTWTSCSRKSSVPSPPSCPSMTSRRR